MEAREPVLLPVVSVGNGKTRAERWELPLAAGNPIVDLSL